MRNANARSSNSDHLPLSPIYQLHLSQPHPKPPLQHYLHLPPFMKQQMDTSSPPIHTRLPDPAHHPGLSKNQTGIRTKTNMVTTKPLQPDQPWDCDHHHGQSYPPR